MSYKSKSLEELLELLSILDSKLDYFRETNEIELPISLDIVGGGALCYWNLRLDNMTRNLDSFAEIDDRVKTFINEVEPGDWLNDNVRRINGKTIYLNDLKFKESNYNFRNINLRFASLKSLLKTKLFSLYNNAKAGFSLRTTNFKKDLKDVYGLLDYLDIEDKSSLDKDYYSFAFDKIFPNTQEYINPNEFKYWNGSKIDLIDKFKLFTERIKMKTLEEMESEPPYTYVLYWWKLSKWNDPKDMFPVYCDYINNHWDNLDDIQQRIFYACMNRLYGKYGLNLEFNIEKPVVKNIVNLDNGDIFPLRDISEDEESDEYFREMGLVFDNFNYKD